MMKSTETNNTELLLRKYDVPVPRYTSYPPVPQWQSDQITTQVWAQQIQATFTKADRYNGISVYIHLPFCEKLCTYCGCNKRITVNHAVEKPYLDAVLAEWDMYLGLFRSKPKISELHLGGGTPTFFSPENLETLIKGITASAHEAINADYSVEVHPNVTTYQHLETLRKCGFNRLSIGIQDFDPHIQEIINRYQTVEKTQQVFEWARSLGFNSINADLVYGLPCQTVHSIQYTLSKLESMKPDRIAFYSYAHVPWISGGQRKFNESDIPGNNEKRKLYELGKVLLKTQGYVELGMDHFALKHDALYKAFKNSTLHRNFMGYTIQNTNMLIGLGCSAISDCGTAYAQNEKEVSKYQESLNKGILPIAKGHMLSNAEQFTKQHIMRLMCQMKTNWSPTDQHNSLWADALVRLQPLANDGIVQITKQSIEITEQGKPFIRNVCAAFDPMFQLIPKEISLYSKAI